MNNKRKLITTIVLGLGTRPVTWTTPIISVVSLPAHAKMSSTPGNGTPVSTIAITGLCNTSAPEDQYFTVRFDTTIATSSSIITILSHGSVDPGAQSGDDAVFFARHSNINLLTLVQRPGPAIGIFDPPCNASLQGPQLLTSATLNSGAVLNFTSNSSGVPNAPTLTLSGFSVTP